MRGLKVRTNVKAGSGVGGTGGPLTIMGRLPGRSTFSDQQTHRAAGCHASADGPDELAGNVEEMTNATRRITGT